MAKTDIKRPRITDKVRLSILGLHRQGLSPGQIKNTLKKNAPSTRSIQEIVTTAKEAAFTEAFKKQDKLWHFGLLREYPEIRGDAVKAIGKISNFAENKLTIRQALWVARLYPLEGDTTKLWLKATAYALTEALFDLSEIEFNTSELDLFDESDLKDQLRLLGLKISKEGEAK